MSVEFEMRKWCAIVKLEGYTTPASARALVQKFHNIVESFRDEGIDLDVFMLVEDENELRSVDESVTRKPDRTKER